LWEDQKAQFDQAQQEQEAFEAISTAVVAGLVFYKKLIPTEEELQTIKAEREAGKDKDS
jgi:hypothetical protein